VQRQPGRVVGHEGEAVDLATQPEVTARRGERELDRAELALARSDAGAPAVVVKGVEAQAFVPDPLDVDVGHRAYGRLREALALGQQLADLVEHRLAVPRKVGGRLALPGCRVDVRRAAARAGGLDQAPTLLRAGDGDRA